MPRKPFKNQAGYFYANRGLSYMQNQAIKDIQPALVISGSRYFVGRFLGVIRNPHKPSLLSNGGAR